VAKPQSRQMLNELGIDHARLIAMCASQARPCASQARLPGPPVSWRHSVFLGCLEAGHPAAVVGEFVLRLTGEEIHEAALDALALE